MDGMEWITAGVPRDGINQMNNSMATRWVHIITQQVEYRSLKVLN